MSSYSISLVTLLSFSLTLLADTYPRDAEAIRSELKSLQDRTTEFCGNLVAGSWRPSRLHVPTGRTNLAEEQISRTNKELAGLRAELLKNLQFERAHAPVETTAGDLAAQRAAAREFNALVERLQAVKIVFDEKSLFGSLSTATKPLGSGIVAIPLTPFDYSRGFAYQCEAQWKSGLVVFRNQRTGEIQWISGWKEGVAVIGENADGSPIVETIWKTGLNSSYDPKLGKWVVARGDWKTPIASVYNPAVGRVETWVSGWKEGAAGVFNPRTQRVEWNSEWKSGVAGYFDPKLGKVLWVSEWKSGVACIWRDEDGMFNSSAGFGSDFGDD